MGSRYMDGLNGLGSMGRSGSPDYNSFQQQYYQGNPFDGTGSFDAYNGYQHGLPQGQINDFDDFYQNDANHASLPNQMTPAGVKGEASNSFPRNADHGPDMNIQPYDNNVQVSPASQSDGHAAGDNDQSVSTIFTEAQFFDELAKRVKETRIANVKALAEKGEDVDFPATDVERLSYVRKLMDAIKNTTNIVDRPCKNGKPGQAAQRFDRGYYSDRDIELASWKVLLGLRDSQLGVSLVEPYHGYRHETYKTFEARFNTAVDVLRQSKATCKQLLDPSFSDRLCDAPDTELQMKLNNKKVNAERDTQNQIGRQVLKGELPADKIASLKVEDNNRPSSSHSRRSARIRGLPEGRLPNVTPKKRTPKSKAKSSTPRRKGNAKIKKEVESDEDETEDDVEEDENEDYSDTFYATPRSSNKRKVQRPSYANDDAESSDDEDASYRPNMETPTKKARTAKGRLPARDGPLSTGKPPRVPPTSAGLLEPSLSGLPSRMGDRSAAPRSTAPSPTGSHFQPGAPAYDPEAEFEHFDVEKKEQYDAYCGIICDLLSLSHKDGKKFSLSDLRRYARGYNIAYANNVYNDPETPHWSFIGHKAFMDGQASVVDHFAMIHQRMMSIAKLRGDMDAAGKYVAHAPFGIGFQTHGEPIEDRALGVIDNEFGVPYHLYPAPEPASAPWDSAHFDYQSLY